ncbi:MAG: lipoprotein [Halioglobus sp.]
MGRCVHKITPLALAMLLTACGQTGPLYLPAPTASEKPATIDTSSESDEPASSAVSGETATTRE